MEWLNYHHLLYFWTVAKEGSLRAASDSLRVSQPSISAQLQALESSLGQKLFRPSGRGKVLTDAGQMVFGYAEEIFTLGGELMNSIRNRPTARARRLNVGLADSFPKLVAHDILQPLFDLADPMHVICREGKISDLLAQLGLHRLDVVLADEPASSSHNLRSFNHLLAKSALTICAAPRLGNLLRRNFPKSLHGAPAVMPSENTPTRRALEKWFHRQRIQPRVIGEFDDAALMSVVAAEGAGFVAVPSAVADDASARYGFDQLGTASGCEVEFYAITAE
ncbi:MAG TPA: LysR family transcriptional regulator, partial [Chthoniobacterales bacterium]